MQSISVNIVEAKTIFILKNGEALSVAERSSHVNIDDSISRSKFESSFSCGLKPFAVNTFSLSISCVRA